MDNKELMKMCGSLARKYDDQQEYDDLVSEGVLKCLELMAEGKKDKNLLYSAAQSAMFEYYNISKSPVKVPNSSAAYSTKPDDDVDGWTALALQQAMYGESVEYEDYMSQSPSSEDLYEKKEYESYVVDVAIKNLTPDELKVMKMRFWDDMTQQETAEVLQISQQALQKREKILLSKLGKLLNDEKSCYK